jgi:hypothetical protein
MYLYVAPWLPKAIAAVMVEDPAAERGLCRAEFFQPVTVTVHGHQAEAVFWF